MRYYHSGIFIPAKNIFAYNPTSWSLQHYEDTMAHIETDVDEHILLIRINRAKKYNALSPEMYHDLGKALFRLNTEPQLRVAVLYAEGKHFTAGVELEKWAPIFGSGNAFPVANGEIDPFGLIGEHHRKPVVIAVQGYCFTWGVEVLLNTEIRVAAKDTQFQMLEVQRGLYPCGGATLRLPREVGWGNAHKVLLTGNRWSGEEAHSWGMVQELVEPGEQFAKAFEIAGQVAAAAPLAVQGCLKATRFSNAHYEDKMACVKQFMADLKPVMESEDAVEGVNSFLERRPAVFKGR
jgi:enoyl-CoA hydratase